jgi:hypothetical protein
MSVNTPPNPNVDTFNNLYWISGDTALTQAEADLRYLKYPVAQGTQNMATTNVNGVLTCNNNVIVNNKSLDIDGALGQIRYADNKVQNTAYTGGNAGTYTNTNMTIDANGKISAISNGAAPVNFLLSNNTWLGTQLWNNTTIGSLQSNATQPLGTDNSNYIPTTAWVQSAISSGAAATQKTYTVQYTTNQSVTLPTDCIGISVRCIGRGGASGNAFDNNGGSWNAGGAGSGGCTITSAGILPFTAGHVLQINFNFYAEIVSTTLSNSILCRASAGANGANATSGGGGAGGVPTTLGYITNTSYGTWNVNLGFAGPNGGSNLAFQSASYPSTGGVPICQTWNNNTVYGAGQNWNGFITLNSFQGPALNILGGVCFITFYLK